jgi:hypothetical protein
MNRRERKQMEKQMGLAKYKKSLTRSQRFDMMSDNIKAGKEAEERMREVRRLQEQGKLDEVSANRISSIATGLMVKGIPYVDAINQAKELYKQEIEALSTKE